MPLVETPVLVVALLDVTEADVFGVDVEVIVVTVVVVAVVVLVVVVVTVVVVVLVVGRFVVVVWVLFVVTVVDGRVVVTAEEVPLGVCGSSSSGGSTGATKSDPPGSVAMLGGLPVVTVAEDEVGADVIPPLLVPLTVG